MTNQSTNSPTCRQRRYTVSRLLELAPQSRPANFDLSKFTYDAARAGVVPPLGACAMANRRASSDRPRGWSQESGSSQDEVIVYRGNRIVNAPERQPTVPPPEDRAQQDEGFARFLKKHSSPTHQRVTAGGRIVPMEQRPRPPLFSLPQANQGTEADCKNNTGDEVNGPIKPSATKLGATSQSEAKQVVTDNVPQQQQQSRPYVSGKIGIADAGGATTATNFNIMPPNNVFAYDGVHHQPNYLQPVTSAPYYAAVPGDTYLMQNLPMYAGGALPLAGFNNPLGLTFPLPYVPNPQMLGIPPSCGITTTPTEPQPREDAYVQNMLSQSTATFEELDRQLKAIDRHRAMTDLDPYIADQRIAIVQLRAQAKSEMTYWSAQLGLGPKGLPKKPPYPPSRTLNVKAATYVPLRTQPSPETLPDSTGSGSVPNGLQFETERPKFDVRSTRRPIPIVPPPEESPSPKKDGEDRVGSRTESIEVDEWGLRIGPPPPEIQHQQSQMLERLARETSISPLGSSEAAVIITPELSSQSISPQEHPADIQEAKAMLDIASESEEWLPTKPGRAPPTVEACYEVQLDAMRLPLGVISKVRMPDGTITEVRGRGLQRPPSFEMDDFEKRYWTKKPAVTKEMWNNFVEVRACGDVPSIVDTFEFKVLGLESHENQMKENARDVLLSHSSEASNGNSSDYKSAAAKDATNAPNFVRGFARKGYRSTVEPSTSSDPSLSILKQSSASSPSMWLQGEDRTGWVSNEHLRNSRVTGSEALHNKGFSSVSIQNVHAMGRLPHLMDGTSDGQRLSAKSMLSAASKAATSYLAPGLVPSPESFYESYVRESRGLAVERENGFLPQIPKKGEM